MASQFGSLGYTIMGKTADLTVVQKTIIDTLHKEGKPPHLNILVIPFNKFVHADAQFYRTNGCWWLFELNSAKVHACKCSLNA